MTPDRPVRRAVWLTLFAVAMGILESAVVVYLRELYYPDGFRFPLIELAPSLARIEIAREACTVLMMLAVAVIAAHDRMDGFFVFAFLFGVWDLVYYAGLKLFLDWPASLGTWDVLFLIPLPWVAPVLAPVLVSLLLVAGFAVHSFAASKQRHVRLRAAEWAAAVTAGIVVVGALCWRATAAFSPEPLHGFPWTIFVFALALGSAPFARATLRAFRA